MSPVQYVLRGTALLLTILMLVSPVLAQGPRGESKEPLVFASAEHEERYKELTLELRCLVCQNQNLADSDAPLAQDLRQEIFDMMQAGKDDEQITSFLVERYGEFVLYRPPVTGNTLALWVLPGVLLLVGATAVFFTVRGRNRRLAAQRQEGSE